MIRVFFGNPGCGKTTVACKMMKEARKKRFDFFRFKFYRNYDHAFANFNISEKIGCPVDLKGLGQWTFPPHSYLVVDEAGIEYNNRRYKSLPQHTIAWLKLHRHAKCDVDFFSQSWEDMDVTIRRLADQLWYVKKIGPFTFCRRVYKRVTVDKNTEQIIDGYKFTKMLSALIPFWGSFKVCFRPKYYKYFDSWSMPEMPVKYAE